MALKKYHGWIVQKIFQVSPLAVGPPGSRRAPSLCGGRPVHQGALFRVLGPGRKERLLDPLGHLLKRPWPAGVLVAYVRMILAQVLEMGLPGLPG